MTPNWVIFVVGLFVTIIWGSVVGAMLYAGYTPSNNTNADKGVETKPN